MILDDGVAVPIEKMNDCSMTYILNSATLAKLSTISGWQNVEMGRTVKIWSSASFTIKQGATGAECIVPADVIFVLHNSSMIANTELKGASNIYIQID